MVGTMVCLAAVTLGVDVGWEPSDKGLEYIIQIKPEQLDSFRGGVLIRSFVPPQHRGELRAYRIQVGNDPLPRIDLPEPPATKTEPPPESQANKTPATLPDTQSAKPLVAPADYHEPSPSEQLAGTPGGSGSSGLSDERSQKYFTAMMIASGTAIGLFAALVYLSWIHVGTRNRYRALLADYMALQPGGQDPVGQPWPA